MSTFKGLLRLLWPVALVSLLASSLLFSLAVSEEEQDQAQAQERVQEQDQAELPLAPDFSLKDLDGKRVALSDLLGRGPVLIDFWATWCKPCVKELPHLHDLYLKYRDRGFQVVAVSEDSPRSLSKVKSFVAGNKYEFLVLLDENSAVQRKFNFRALPYTVLLDKDGHVIHSRVGYRPGDERVLEGMFLPLLEAQEAAGEVSNPPADAGQEDQDTGDESEAAEKQRDQRNYVKKVKGQEARKVQAEERDE